MSKFKVTDSEGKLNYYDDLSLIEMLNKQFDLMKFEQMNKADYEEGYSILLEYYDSIADEEKDEVDKRLEECGL